MSLECLWCLVLHLEFNRPIDHKKLKEKRVGVHFCVYTPLNCVQARRYTCASTHTRTYARACKHTHAQHTVCVCVFFNVMYLSQDFKTELIITIDCPVFFQESRVTMGATEAGMSSSLFLDGKGETMGRSQEIKTNISHSVNSIRFRLQL